MIKPGDILILDHPYGFNMFRFEMIVQVGKRTGKRLVVRSLDTGEIHAIPLSDYTFTVVTGQTVKEVEEGIKS